MITRRNCFENRVSHKRLSLHKGGYITKLDFVANDMLEGWELPGGTELSYDWYDSKGRAYTIVREPGKPAYAADAKIMFIV